MSCEVASVSSETIVEMLSNRVKNAADWVCINEQIRLMKKLVEANKRNDLSPHQHREIYDLGQQVEKQILKLAKEETDQIGNDWRRGGIKPMELKWQKSGYQDLASEAPTSKLRKGFRDCAKRIQEFLDQGSEDLAEYFLRDLESSLLCAEELLVEGKELCVISANLGCARSKMNDLLTVVHVRTVGLPRIARKRGVNLNQLLDELKCRIEIIKDSLAPLKVEAEERRIEIRRGADELRRKEAQENLECELEREIKAIERRSKEAGQAARQFLEHAKLGNAGGAQSCLYQIRRKDGGVPVIFREMYGKLLRGEAL